MNDLIPGRKDVSSVLFEKQGHLGKILLNRPNALNALNLEMVTALSEQLRTWEQDPDISIVVIEGAGDKAFCSGGDIREIYEAWRNGDEDLAVNFYRNEYLLCDLIHRYSKPYISFLDGITMGGGAGLSINGQFRVACEKTLFAMPETSIGFFPDVGGGYFLSRCPGKLGMFLGLTGQTINDSDCYYAGLATHVIAQQDKPLIMERFAQIELSDANRDVISQLVEGVLKPFHKATQPGFLQQYHPDIDEIFSAGSVIDIFHRLDLSQDEAMQNIRRTFGTKSPLSLFVTFAQLEQGESLSFREVMKMECRLALRMAGKPDLYEGIRSALIDRDKNPVWQAPDVGSVDPRVVMEYFDFLPDDLELVFE